MCHRVTMSVSFPRLPAVTARTRSSSSPSAFGRGTDPIIDITMDVADGLSLNIALEHPLAGPAHGRLNVAVEPPAVEPPGDDRGNADAA